MNLTITRRFRKIEKPDSRISRLQTLDGGTNRIVDAVSEDEDFDVVDALRLDACHRERQGCGAATMGRNENASSRHLVRQIVWRTSADPAVSATRGWARLLRTPGNVGFARGAVS